VNNEEYNMEVFDKIPIVSMVLYEMHWDHRYEINYTIVHNRDEELIYIKEILYIYENRKRYDRLPLSVSIFR
jgi:hypothetical protein